MDRKTLAKQLFSNDHNCAQSVLLAFADFLGKKEQELRAVAAGFGGGMGGQQLTCGAVTGAYMVLGIHSTNLHKDNASAKALSAELIRDFSNRFREHHQHLSCRNITGVDFHTEEGKKEAMERNLFDTVCSDAVTGAVKILEDILPEG